MFTRNALIRRDSSTRIEIAPLVDIMFLLLLFFVVTASLKIAETGIKLKLPSAVTSDKQQKSLSVVIGRDQRLYVNTEPVSEHGLFDKIRALDSKITISLLADETTPYQRVIQVLDTIRLAGGTNVVLQADQKITPHASPQ